MRCACQRILGRAPEAPEQGEGGAGERGREPPSPAPRIVKTYFRGFVLAWPIRTLPRRKTLRLSTTALCMDCKCFILASYMVRKWSIHGS